MLLNLTVNTQVGAFKDDEVIEQNEVMNSFPNLQASYSEALSAAAAVMGAGLESLANTVTFAAASARMVIEGLNVSIQWVEFCVFTSKPPQGCLRLCSAPLKHHVPRYPPPFFLQV